jgi:hypothetical protein
MKLIFTAMAALSALILATLCFAVPTPTLPTATNVGSNMITLNMLSDGTGTGYFTLRPGTDADCGDGTKVAFGSFSTHHGSLPLTANVPGNYTVRTLKQNTNYTACFTADSPSGSNLNPTPVLANIATSAAKTYSSPGWGRVGMAGFSPGAAHFTSFSFSPDGTPYLVYVDANNGNKITVMKYSAAAWNLVGGAGFAVGTAAPASLAFSPDGTPHLSFVDAVSNYATVMRFNGTGWSTLGTPVFSADTMATSLAFAPDGSPWVAYVDASTSLVTVIRYVGSTWSIVGGNGFSSGGADFISLAFSPDGAPSVAYSDQGSYGNGKITVMKYAGNSWSVVGGMGFSAGAAGFVSLAFDPDGTPYVAYQDGGAGNEATVMKFDGSLWGEVGGAGFSAGAVGYTSLAVGPDGSPYVAFQDGAAGYRATVMKYSDNVWNVVGTVGYSAGAVESTVLAIAPDGTPYIAFADHSAGAKATVMRLGNKPTIGYASPPASSAIVGQEYVFTPTGTDADSFTVTGTLPPGITFNPVNGELSGTPTTVGIFSAIVISAGNAYGTASLIPFSITVSASGSSGNVKRVSDSATYPTLASALLATPAGSDTLKILATVAPEGVAYEGSGTVTLEGGNDPGWNQQSGQFSSVSSITITSGTLVMNQIVVQ